MMSCSRRCTNRLRMAVHILLLTIYVLLFMLPANMRTTYSCKYEVDLTRPPLFEEKSSSRG